MVATEMEFAEVEVPPTFAMQVPGRCAPDPASISTAIQTAFSSMAALLRQHSLSPAGPPRVIYNDYNPQGVDFILAMPVSTPPAEAPPALKKLDGAKAYRFAHHGPYRDLMQTYGRITAFMKTTGRMENDADWARYMPMWEEYLNSPDATPQDQLLTYIYLPVR